MRLFEFAGNDNLDKFAVLLKNILGRHASKKTPAKYNWASINRLANSSGIEITADYETFKSMYDSSPLLQKIIKNFNADGVELDVPGSPEYDKVSVEKGKDDSEEAVAKMAAGAVSKQISQNQQGVQV
jgi:hypothetical protein